MNIPLPGAYSQVRHERQIVHALSLVIDTTRSPYPSTQPRSVYRAHSLIPQTIKTVVLYAEALFGTNQDFGVSRHYLRTHFLSYCPSMLPVVPAWYPDLIWRSSHVHVVGSQKYTPPSYRSGGGWFALFGGASEFGRFDSAAALWPSHLGAGFNVVRRNYLYMQDEQHLLCITPP